MKFFLFIIFAIILGFGFWSSKHKDSITTLETDYSKRIEGVATDVGIINTPIDKETQNSIASTTQGY